MNLLPSLPSFPLPFLLPLFLPLFPLFLPGSDQKNPRELYKKSAFLGRYPKEGAKLSTRTRNKLQKIANNVLVLSSHALEHVGINGRVIR